MQERASCAADTATVNIFYTWFRRVCVVHIYYSEQYRHRRARHRGHKYNPCLSLVRLFVARWKLLPCQSVSQPASQLAHLPSSRTVVVVLCTRIFFYHPQNVLPRPSIPSLPLRTAPADLPTSIWLEPSVVGLKRETASTAATSLIPPFVPLRFHYHHSQSENTRIHTHTHPTHPGTTEEERSATAPSEISYPWSSQLPHAVISPDTRLAMSWQPHPIYPPPIITNV